MEEEARRILRAAVLKPVTKKGLGSLIQQNFEPIGGIDIEPVRSAPRSPNMLADEE